MMKMCDLTLESYYWTKDKVECPYELLVLLKEQANMDYFHKQLNNYCLYSLSHVMYDKKRVSEVIYDAVVFQSIIKVGYKIFKIQWNLKKGIFANIRSPKNGCEKVVF